MFSILAGLSSGIFTLLSSIIGRILSMIEMRTQNQIDLQNALLSKANVDLSNVISARTMPQANFARRCIAISFAATMVAIVIISLVNPASTIVIPKIYMTGFSFIQFLFGAGTGQEIIFLQVPLTIVIVPFIDILGVVIGFYFGSGGSLKGLRQ